MGRKAKIKEERRNIKLALEKGQLNRVHLAADLENITVDRHSRRNNAMALRLTLRRNTTPAPPGYDWKFANKVSSYRFVRTHAR